MTKIKKARTSSQKGLKYFLEKKVFPLTSKNGYEIYGVEGVTGVWMVKFEQDSGRFSCNCKNIREMDCSHIKATKIYKETR